MFKKCFAPIRYRPTRPFFKCFTKTVPHFFKKGKTKLYTMFILEYF